ncbi:MAG TPA: LacI family transcriptional regulator, partial [Firmicutes bacterium]|nr:LacI family transcriptional regulator [Bacillota bacterium]
MAATIKDVAKLAGVSHTTVSMVIHKDKRITSITREKVEKAIKELNYHPNYMARSLVRGKSNAIAVVATYFSSMFEVNFLKGLESEGSDSPYNINQYSTRGRTESKQEILQSLLYGKMADAVIILS